MVKISRKKREKHDIIKKKTNKRSKTYVYHISM